jgi:exodeoxyribonuclease VII large subunit
MDISADLLETQRTLYTVSRLNRETRFILNEYFGSLWIEGEISNLSAPASGHLYFTLKDAEAQVRCAMFRPQVRALARKPENGGYVLVKAQVGLYEPRGDFQLIVETIEAAGGGALLRAFEALKQRLAAEGLFDAAHKKPIPSLPRCVGVITSPTGAAVRDVLTVLKRRFPAIPVIVFPARVQGAEAKFDIARALALADRSKLCDVLILARGGGSPEDLWAFNEESVARAIYACETPVVAGIGHEIDFTIADFVVDLRAPTPSAAAEAVSPAGDAWLERFRRLESQLAQRIQATVDRHARTLAFLERRLRQVHPNQRLRTQSQRLDELELRLARALRAGLMQRKGRLHAQTAQLLKHHPEPRLLLLEARSGQLRHRLETAIRRLLEKQDRRTADLGHRLHAVSPLATLARGYAIASRAEDGEILRSFREIGPGELMETRLADGFLISRIERAEN